MPDITKSIEILFTGNDKLSSTMKSIRSGFSSLDDSVASITGPLADMAAVVEKTELALAAMAAGGLALAVKEAGAFHDSFAEINTLAQTTGEGMTKFRDDIIAYAQDSTQSIEDINTATYNAISMGYDYKDSLAALSDAEKLAVGGKTDLNSATELLLGTMNAYGASVNETAKYSDAMFTVVKDGKTTISELATRLSQVTGIAAGAGVDFDTLGAAIAEVTAAGTPTGQAITDIKAAISNIIKPTADATKTAEALGIQFDAGALKSKGFYGVLKEVYQTTGGNVEQMGKLFGSVEGLNAAMVLGADKSGIFAKAIQDMADKTGATDKAFAEMSANTKLALQNLYNNLKVVLIESGSPLLDQFGKDVGALSGVLKGIKLGFDEGAFDPLFDALNEAGAGLEEWLKGVAAALPEALEGVDWSKLLASVQGLGKEIGGAFEAIFGNLDLTNAEDLQKAIQKVVDGVAGLTNVTAGIVESWQPFLSMIGEAIDKFVDLDDGSQKSAGNVLGLGQAVDKLLGPLKSFLGAVDKIGVSLSIIAASSATKTITSLAASATSATGGLSTFAGILTQTVGSATAGQALGVMGLGYAIGYSAGILLDKFVPGVHDASQAVADWLAKILGVYDAQGKTNEALDTQTGILDKMRGKFGEIGEKLTSLSSKELLNFKISLDDSGINIEQFNERFDDLPKEKQVSIVTKIERGDYKGAIDALNAIPDDKVIEVDASNVEPLKQKLHELGLAVRDDVPKEKLIQMGYKVDDTGAKKFEQQTDETIEKAKAKVKELEKEKLEIQAKIDIANIEADAEKVKAAFAGMADIGVADIEAGAKKYVAALESINSTANSTADILGGLFDLWGGAKSPWEKVQTTRWIEEQLDIEREQLATQKKLIEAQIKFYQTRSDKLASGDALVTVQADGLEPELEAFIWKILEKIQVRVAEEYSEYLLGLNPGGA